MNLITYTDRKIIKFVFCFLISLLYSSTNATDNISPEIIEANIVARLPEPFNFVDVKLFFNRDGEPQGKVSYSDKDFFLSPDVMVNIKKPNLDSLTLSHQPTIDNKIEWFALCFSHGENQFATFHFSLKEFIRTDQIKITQLILCDPR